MRVTKLQGYKNKQVTKLQSYRGDGVFREEFKMYGVYKWKEGFYSEELSPEIVSNSIKRAKDNSNGYWYSLKKYKDELALNLYKIDGNKNILVGRRIFKQLNPIVILNSKEE